MESSIFPNISTNIILASKSKSRSDILAGAGLKFECVAPQVDEAAILESLKDSDLGASDLAEILARAKAEAVSLKYGSACVIGGDQVLALDDRIFTKADGFEAARDTLLALSGRRHQLHSAVVVAIDGETRWAHVETVDMTMREMSPAFIGRYLGIAGEAVYRSVGAYEVEGLGVQLFDKIEGDHFTVRGLPLVALLNHLYETGVLS